jgi:calcium-dependent protein kinase
MGGKSSKKSKNEDLKKIGEEANKNSPSQFYLCTNVNLTNDLLIGKSKNNPKEDYTMIKILGEGSYARVYKVKNRLTSAVYAMKVINKSYSCTVEEENEILNEINILKTMDHPSILKIFEFYSNKTSYSIVTELCPQGELFNEIIQKGPFTEKYSAYVMYQILSAVNYCHKMHIIHRDLKPENILIVDRDKDYDLPIIKICDFGTSKIVEKGQIQKKKIGSSYYMAPEVLKKHYNEKCDVWSCGVIMYILLTAEPPFNGREDDEIFAKILKGQYDTKPLSKYSSNCLDLIENLLKYNDNERFSAEQALNHVWFQDFKSKELYNKITDRDVIKTLFKNLKNYKRTSIIQETALAYLVHQFPRIKDVINACKLFNQIDNNGDGKIGETELYNGLIGRYKTDTLEKDVDEIFKTLDMDNNGFIEYEEFVRAAVSKEYFVTDNVLKFAFRFFDKDNSGEIEFNEIKALFSRSIEDKASVEQTLNQIIKEVDINNDGKINFKEFSIVMKKMIQ